VKQSPSLDEAIVEVLTTATVPLYAREVVDECRAAGIDADRTLVNQALYGPLSASVKKGSDHRWVLVANGSSAPVVAKPSGQSSEVEVANGSVGDETVSTSDAADERKSPSCPQCGGAMRERTARRGRNAGGKFFGCAKFPECTGTVSITPVSESDIPAAEGPHAGAPQQQQSSAPPAAPLPRAVPWQDASLHRAGWICRYATAGGSLRSAPESLTSLRPLTNCWLARPDEGQQEITAERRRFAGVARKLIERGMCPPLDPVAERKLLELAGVGVADPDVSDGHLAPEATGTVDLGENALHSLWSVESPVIDASQLQFDSDEERHFFEVWCVENLAADAVRGIVAQAPLDGLARAVGGKLERDNAASGERRVDFLFQGSGFESFVVEIDGEQHEEAADVDADRDQLLESLGFDTLRVPVSEVRAGSGPALKAIKKRVGKGQVANPTSRSQALLTQAPAGVHRAVLAIVEAALYGLIDGDSWVVELDDPLDVVAELLPPYLDLLAAVDQMWSTNVMPSKFEVRSGETGSTFSRSGCSYEKVGGASASASQLRILIESDRSPLEEIGLPDDVIPEIVIRSAFLPVRVADRITEGAQRESATSNSDALVEALRVVLRSVFALRDFRDGQTDALVEVMQGRPCAVLLPTGAGKSLIYQLAGLCLPGRTIIVDPIIALMEDQVRGLVANGIDRVIAISMNSSKQAGRGELNELVASGDAFFTFMSPERLQQRSFRGALRALGMGTPINIAVVDEAHCVSEWGHDFRTSYLNLGRILREHSRGPDDSAGAPILALTGTASRAVLRDVLNELEITIDGDRTVIQPSSFDRPELRYSIVSVPPAEAVAALRGVVETLPEKFGLPSGTFFSSRGAATMSGIVFCPHANGRFGVVDVAKALENVTGTSVPFYSGGAPRGYETEWESVKRNNAESFKRNVSPILVSTKAFGMGIDKPNVRFIVHLGIPGSIESYYQEVGRAGRDRGRSECFLVTTEYDEQRDRRLLDDESDLESIRERHAGIKLATSDDVSNQLFFHTNSFIGEVEELATTRELLATFGHALGSAETVNIPMDRSDKQKRLEKGLHRLVVLGVLRDYLVDPGGKKYEAELAGCSSRQVLDSLLSYVRRSQPARAETIAQELAEVEALPLDGAILRCAEALIAFVYDTIERSRRRSLREMWLAARESKGDANGAFRERILDYLTQGAVAPALERLVEKEKVEFADWMLLLDDVSARATNGEQDAATDLRGGSARLLSSSPDHPGLLFARGFSELLIHDGELEELTSSVRAAAATADRYGVSHGDVVTFAMWLVARARASTRRGGITAVALALKDVRPSELGIKPADVSSELGLAVLHVSAEMTDTTEMLEAVLASQVD
jgi:ATP-dependent DNA helicase RecQ